MVALVVVLTATIQACQGGTCAGSLLYKAAVHYPEVCPPPLVPRGASCGMAEEPMPMSFYMFAVSGAEEEDVENVNLFDLAGVLAFVHDEVVGEVPRGHNVSRIVRHRVTMHNTQVLHEKTGRQFGPYVDFRRGQALNRNKLWWDYGFVVGCQREDRAPKGSYVPRKGSEPACDGKRLEARKSESHSASCGVAKRYSLPGPCPGSLNGAKTSDCRTFWPGGRCKHLPVTGQPDCTYHTEFAGAVLLDELAGIDSYDAFAYRTDAQGNVTGEPSGNREYVVADDRGVKMSFWDGRLDADRNAQRMEAVLALFGRRYAELPSSLPEPFCDTPARKWPSLFCASVMRIEGYENPLMKAQLEKDAGIFACDEFAVFTADGTTELSHGIVTENFPGAPVGRSIDGTAANAELFVNFWDHVKTDGRWRRHDWIIKADPDTVLLAERARVRLSWHSQDLKPVFIRNCIRFGVRDDPHEAHPNAGLFGSLESVSRPAMELYFAGDARCKSEFNWAAWGEDQYMGMCLKMLGAEPVTDLDSVADERCNGASCDSDNHAAFHAFKSVPAWLTCWNAAMANSAWMT